MSNKERPNETLIQVPASFEDSTSLRRFLALLVEKIDIILGYRGQEEYAKLSDLQSPSIAPIEEQLATVNEELTEKINQLESKVDTDQEEAFKTIDLPVEFRDFNNSVWFTFKGFGEFTATGADMTNPPVALIGATVYTIFVSSYLTVGGGAVTTVNITSATTSTMHTRAGPTEALAITLGWL